jgi:mRNA interferase MazF
LVISKPYIPDQGDLVWLDFDPQAGHEQAGRRPTLVLSPKSYNQASKFMLCCPVTSRVKGYPFEVLILGLPKISGVALSDQIRSLDWLARNAQFIDRVPDSVLSEVSMKQKLLLPK